MDSRFDTRLLPQTDSDLKCDIIDVVPTWSLQACQSVLCHKAIGRVVFPIPSSPHLVEPRSKCCSSKKPFALPRLVRKMVNWKNLRKVAS